MLLLLLLLLFCKDSDGSTLKSLKMERKKCFLNANSSHVYELAVNFWQCSFKGRLNISINVKNSTGVQRSRVFLLISISNTKWVLSVKPSYWWLGILQRLDKKAGHKVLTKQSCTKFSKCNEDQNLYYLLRNMLWSSLANPKIYFPCG